MTRVGLCEDDKALRDPSLPVPARASFEPIHSAAPAAAPSSRCVGRSGGRVELRFPVIT